MPRQTRGASHALRKHRLSCSSTSGFKLLSPTLRISCTNRSGIFPRCHHSRLLFTFASFWSITAKVLYNCTSLTANTMADSNDMHDFKSRLHTFEIAHQISKRRASSSKKKAGGNTVEWPHKQPAAEEVC